jgi:AAA+ superfamily predicted ATPase
MSIAALRRSRSMISTTPFLSSRSRVFVTYGCTAEQYCLASGITVPYEKFIHDHLTRNGYETVVFFSHQGCFFLDERSRDTVFGRNTAPPVTPAAPMPARGKLLAHSTGLRVLAAKQTTTPADSAARLRYPDMAHPAQMLPLLRRLFWEGTTSVAVVVASDAIFSTFAATETNTQFEAFITHDVVKVPLERRAVLIFNFPVENPWEHLARHRWNFLLGDSPSSRDGAARAVLIGDPGADEVERHLQTLHVRDGTWLDADTFAESVVRLTAHLHACRQTGENRLGLAGLSPLTGASVIDRTAVDRLVGGPSAKPAAERLSELVGLESVKRYLLAKAAEAAHYRRNASPPPPSQECARLVPSPVPDWRRRLKLHAVLQGNPGTGKTTVAQLMGDLYRDAGLLDVGHVVKVTRGDLVGEYVGHTAPRVQAAVHRAMGGILFVDEAYDLCRSDDDDFGLEAVAALTEAMSANDGRFAVVLAGYPDDMRRLLATNDGLERRFNEILTLDDFGPAELETILRRFLADAPLAPDLAAALPRLCRAIHDTREANFGNAGTMEQLADDIRRARIVAGANTAGLAHLPPETARLLDRPATSDGGVLEELDALVGLTAVKNRVRTIFNRLAVERQRGEGGDVMPGHMVFAGGPGTGKTTVARLMARQLNALGLLPRPDVHETTAGNLIAGYVGQTAERARDFLDRGVGRLIFIDEAHQLARDARSASPSTFGRDVIDVLVPFAEENRNKCVIILAGYRHAMDELLGVDDGLTRRFTHLIPFEDYSPDDLVTIFDGMARRANFTWPSDAGRDMLRKHFVDLKARLGRQFGNAGTVRSVFDACLDRHANRLATLGAKAGRETLFTLTLEDLPDGR